MNNIQHYRPVHQNDLVSDLLIHQPYSFLMLEHFGINLQLQEKTVMQVCEAENINSDLFLVIANLYAGAINPDPIHYEKKDILQIINYLRHCHLFYKEEKYPQIKAYIQLIKKLNPNPENVMLERFFKQYFDEVSEHLDYENSTVFPYITDLLSRLDGDISTDLINYSVSQYRDHHDNIEEKLSDLKNLLVKYLPMGNDNSARRKLLFSLSELEFDLHIHSKIEDFVLIPLVEQMEQKLQHDDEE
jgi:regulator of cell morphogenesis and NO signaling